MGFKVKVTGLDKAQAGLDKMISNLSTDEIAKWFEKTAQVANQICPDTKVKFVRGTEKGKLGQFAMSDPKKGTDCVVRAINQVMPEAPEPAKTMLRQYKAALQKHLAQESTKK